VSGRLTVVITWMDGKQEIYSCASAQEINGVLYLRAHLSGITATVTAPDRQFPIANIRTWTTEGQ